MKDRYISKYITCGFKDIELGQRIACPAIGLNKIQINIKYIITKEIIIKKILSLNMDQIGLCISNRIENLLK